MLKKKRELAVAEIGQEHGFEHADRHAKLVREPGHRAVAGIEIGACAGLLRERIVVPVVVAHSGAVVEVTAGAAELLNPGVFIRRDGLSGELPADPIGFLGEHDAHAVAESGERGRETTDSAPYNGYIAPEFSSASGGNAPAIARA